MYVCRVCCVSRDQFEVVVVSPAEALRVVPESKSMLSADNMTYIVGYSFTHTEDLSCWFYAWPSDSTTPGLLGSSFAHLVPAEYVSDGFVTCQAPVSPIAQSVRLCVSLDGVHCSRSQVTFTYTSALALNFYREPSSVSLYTVPLETQPMLFVSTFGSTVPLFGFSGSVRASVSPAPDAISGYEVVADHMANFTSLQIKGPVGTQYLLCFSLLGQLDTNPLCFNNVTIAPCTSQLAHSIDYDSSGYCVCELGYEQNTLDARQCNKCPADTYRESYAASKCVACPWPLETINNTQLAVSVDQCVCRPGFVRDPAYVYDAGTHLYVGPGGSFVHAPCVCPANTTYYHVSSLSCSC